MRCALQVSEDVLRTAFECSEIYSSVLNDAMGKVEGMLKTAQANFEVERQALRSEAEAAKKASREAAAAGRAG